MPYHDWIIASATTFNVVLMSYIIWRGPSMIREIAESLHQKTTASLDKKFEAVMVEIVKLEKEAHDERVRFASDVTDISPRYSENGPRYKASEL